MVVVAVVVVFLAASVPVDAFPPFSFLSPQTFSALACLSPSAGP